MCKYLYPPWINNFGNFGRVEPPPLIEKNLKKSKKIKIKIHPWTGFPYNQVLSEKAKKYKKIRG
nr:hypothetical protein [Methanothermobacter thermautotrophicus]